MKAKKTVKMLLCLVMMALAVSNAEAQGLKGLKSKLGGALGGAVGGVVGNKVGGAAGSAVGNALGTKAGTMAADAVGNNKKKNNGVAAQIQSGVASTGDDDYSEDSEEKSYGETLLNAEDNELNELHYLGHANADGLEISKSAPTLKELMASRPAYFPSSTVNSEDGRAQVEQALAVMTGLYFAYAHNENKSFTTIMNQQTAKAEELMANAAPYNDIAMELFTLMQQRGIDPEKASEEQLQALSAEVMGKKLGIPADELVKMSKMSEAQADAYMRSKYPAAAAKAKQLGYDKAAQNVPADLEEEAQHIDKLCEELEALYAQLYGTEEERKAQDNKRLAELEAAAANPLANIGFITGMMQDQTEVFQMLRPLYKEMVDSWPTSDECKAINAKSDELNKRLDKWMADNNKGWNEEFPSWWKSEHEALNKTAQQWNAKQAERWNETLKQYETKFVTVLTRVGEIEEEAYAIPEDRRPANMMMIQMKLNQFHDTLHKYLSFPFFILDSPCVGEITVSETV